MFYTPDVDKSPPMLRSFEKYPARFIGDNPELIRRVPKILDRVDQEFTRVFPSRHGNIGEIVEMRVVLESETISILLKASEIPKNLW